MIGRYYAMDRDNRWDRVQQAYDLMTQGKGEFTADSASEALAAAYARDENDEFVKATRIGDAVPMIDGDALIFMNFRADRAREITRAFVDTDFTGFARRHPGPELRDADRVRGRHQNRLRLSAHRPGQYPGEWLAKQGKTQLRISETEKYAHVTFFFNGGEEACFTGEDREIVAPARKWLPMTCSRR
jgi:2,3-bisphosphoglycerate-independent phosphoglycerate mutase